MDVEEEELACSNDDHDGTDELSIDRAGMLVIWSFSGMIDDSTRSQLQELYKSLYVFLDLDPDDVASDDTLQTFHAEICVFKDKYRWVKTIVC